MQQENILVNNHISIVGKINSDFVYSHEVYGEGFYQFDVEIFRLSQTSDILPVTISERLIDRTQLPMGSLVHIVGQIRSYNNYVESDRKNKLILTIFTRDIELLEDVEHINPNDAYLNGFICKPVVYRTTPFGREISDILLAVNRSYNKSDYIPCIAWGRNARFSGKLQVGDHIRIWGRMQSRLYQKKYENGNVIDKIAYEVSISKIELSDSGEERNENDEA